MKQPYIPLYVGDYIKDTRALPLHVRGAWADIIFYAWDSKTKGILNVTLEELSGMLACDKSVLALCLNELINKDICDVELATGNMFDGLIKITVRRIVRDVAKSQVMSERGRKGGKAAMSKFNQSKNAQAKSGSDNSSIKNKKESVIFPFNSEEFKSHWELWLQFRKEIGHPVKSVISEQASLKFLSQFDEPTAMGIIEKSIANSWRGLFNPDRYEKSTITKAESVQRFTDYAKSRRGQQ